MTNSDYNTYFAAANSCDGFVSFFDKVFSPHNLSHLYIIQGGSGTGKSRLMREVADEAVKRGEEVEYFLCSSDPKSLDGVILCERKSAIIDGTAPHVFEPVCPGAYDEIINLGEFWDSVVLSQKRDEIEKLTAQKKEHYRLAYSYLSIAGGLYRLRDEILSGYVKKSKLESFARRFAKRYERSEEVSDIRLIEGISHDGKTHLKSFYNKAKEHCFIKDKNGISHLVFDALEREFKAQNIAYSVSYDALDTKKINALYLKKSRTSIELLEGEKEGDIIINTDRFFDREALGSERTSLRGICKNAEKLCSFAQGELRASKILHEKIESIYITAMNFEKKEKYTKNLIEDIFKQGT